MPASLSFSAKCAQIPAPAGWQTLCCQRISAGVITEALETPLPLVSLVSSLPFYLLLCTSNLGSQIVQGAVSRLHPSQNLTLIFPFFSYLLVFPLSHKRTCSKCFRVALENSRQSVKEMFLSLCHDVSVKAALQNASRENRATNS